MRLAAAAHDIRAAWRRGVSLDDDILNAFIVEMETLAECLITQRAMDRPGQADVLRAERSRREAIGKLMTVRTEAHAAQKTASTFRSAQKRGTDVMKANAQETRRRIHELMPAARHKARFNEGDWVEELQHAWKMLHPEWGPPPSKATIHRHK